jgi:hypothetical protein
VERKILSLGFGHFHRCLFHRVAGRFTIYRGGKFAGIGTTTPIYSHRGFAST